MSELSINGGHHAHEHEAVTRLAAAIVGKRIVEVVDNLPTEDPGWSDHGSVEIVFDDGSRLDCGGWGHDAWGPAIFYTPATDPPPTESVRRGSDS